jgi:hypothetical protein
MLSVYHTVLFPNYLWSDQATLVFNVIPGLVRPLHAFKSGLHAEGGVEKRVTNFLNKAKDS